MKNFGVKRIMTQYNIELIKKENFDIQTPKLEVKDFNKENKHIIFCDGSYYTNLNLSYASIAGIVVDTTTNKVIAEFFAPLKTKNILNQEIKTDFEGRAIMSSLDVIKILGLKDCIIYNDSLKHINKLNKPNIKWIPREENIAHKICEFAKEVYKNQQKNSIEKNKELIKIYNIKTDQQIAFISHRKKENGFIKYYTFAIDQNLNVIDSIENIEDKIFSPIDLAIKILEQHNCSNKTLIFNKNFIEMLKTHLSKSSEIKNETLDKFYEILLSYDNIGVGQNGELLQKASMLTKSKKFRKTLI